MFAFLRFPFLLLLSSASMFALCRLLFIGLYSDYFSTLTSTQYWHVFWQGFRFDMHISVIVFSPILLIAALPLKVVQKPLLLKKLAYIGLLLSLIMLALTLIDITYFGEVYRHIGQELFQLTDDFDLIIELALTSRIIYTLAGIVLLILFTICYKSAVINTTARQSVTLSQPIWLRFILYAAFVLFCFWLARGMIIQSRPIGYADAFKHNATSAESNLILNSVFVIAKEAKNRQSNTTLDILTEQEKQQCHKKCVDNFQFKATSASSNNTKKNVVFILLESWSYQYIDGLAGSHYHVTPFIDSLIPKAQVWDRFYAAGQRSIIGIQAALTSTPALNNFPALGFGLELNRLNKPAEILNQHHYRTLMLQSSNRRSFNMDGIASILGFQEYYGKEDIPLVRQYPQDTPKFGWDYDSLMFLNQKLNETEYQQKPFFAFLFTGTTHEPFADPGAEFHVYPHDNANKNGFLNTLRYSDWSLQQFMQNAAQQPWYNNTIFIFTADHVLKTSSDHLHEQFHIPLIIYTPDGSLAPLRQQTLATQYDLLPTLFDLLGIGDTISTFGQSLLHPQIDNPPLMLNRGDAIGVISNSGSAVLNGEQQSELSNTSPALQQEIQQLKWKIIGAEQKLKKNQWVE
ncbi:LTA synthase family protein [Pasteurellaceae bacterium USgator11]|nr:LTA synthase family protein [Pasteurellaceae bacterium UScroc12]TNG97670.1 LTA synthase family protein [Pasteurellaceae bacterium USgator41]TNH01502.1 LTA synthase family protein [Pasteurellaceae bacterium UScroc31]TNH02601.1 LTA synthase family protein [Pasteurellaceae bacterium USgator11]